MPKYSVIVPIYNAEKTLRRCVDSLLREGYPDAEILLVNDGSSDGSGEICRDYADRYPNVLCLEKENGGVSAARNMGLDHAGGDYVVFVDSDDYAVGDFFDAMDKAMQEHDADWFFFSYCVDDGKTRTPVNNSPVFCEDRSAVVRKVISAICYKTINSPGAKVFKRTILNEQHIRFPVGASVAEDRAFNIRYSLFVSRLMVSEHILYCLNIENNQSLSRKRHADLDKQFSITGQYVRDALQNAPNPEEEKEQYRRALNFGVCRSIYHDAKLMHKDRLNWFERQRRLGEKCGEINRKHMKYPKTRFCTMVTLPVRLRLTFVIDAVAWKLNRQ